MRYVWTRTYRQYQAGDGVPETLPSGVVATLLEHGRIKPAPQKQNRPGQNKAVLRTRNDK